jgi:hypothetical protein
MVSDNTNSKKLESIPLGDKVWAGDIIRRYAKIKVMKATCILEVTDSKTSSLVTILLNCHLIRIYGLYDAKI